MKIVRPVPVPAYSLLKVYAEAPGFADAYVAEVDRAVDLAELVSTFYVTWLFKTERALLRLAGYPSADSDARELARGRTDVFAAWTLETRSDRELIMCDLSGRTRSWFMVQPGADDPNRTHLFFGSAITAVHNKRPSIGWGFTSLLGVHRQYSVALLKCAVLRLNRSTSRGQAWPG